TVVAEDPVSIARYGRRWMKIIEADDSPIDTEAEAQAMANAAVSDIAWPEAEQQIEALYFPAAEIGDLYRFRANGVHYDRDHDWAVASVRHFLALDRQRTTIRTRGKPAGMYRQWFRASSLPPSVVLYAECQARIVSSTATTVTVEVLSVPPYGTVERVSVGGATLASGPEERTPSPSGTRWTFNRPAFRAGGGQAVFRASAFGHQSDDDHIVIPEQGRDTVALVMRAQVVSVTASQIVVRAYVGPLHDWIRAVHDRPASRRLRRRTGDVYRNAIRSGTRRGRGGRAGVAAYRRTGPAPRAAPHPGVHPPLRRCRPDYRRAGGARLPRADAVPLAGVSRGGDAVA